MTDNDHDLLRQFTRDQSQDAFTALVNRHVNLVYSAALRQVRSPRLAQEIAQFQELKSLALTNNRSALTLNRTLMAPIAD